MYQIRAFQLLENTDLELAVVEVFVGSRSQNEGDFYKQPRRFGLSSSLIAGVHQRNASLQMILGRSSASCSCSRRSS
jgi:hypothetical protein